MIIIVKNITIFKYLILLADDPYYCGLRARVPNFVKMAKNGHTKQIVQPSPYGHVRPQPAPTYITTGYVHAHAAQIYGHHVPLPEKYQKKPPIMYHARSFESGLGTYVCLSFLTSRVSEITRNLFLNK